MTERERAIELLKKLYGPLKEGNRVESSRYSLKEIASNLGYDEGQLSRILNPGHGKESSEDTYRRLSQRLEMNIAAEDNKGSNVWKFVAAILAVLCAVLAFQNFAETEEENPEILNPEKRLNGPELKAFLDIYQGFIEYRLVALGVGVNAELKEGIFDETGYEERINTLRDDIETIIVTARDRVKDINLYSPQGVELSAVFEENANNQIDSNLADVLPLLLNKSIPTSSLINVITNKTDHVQSSYRSILDSIAYPETNQ